MDHVLILNYDCASIINLSLLTENYKAFINKNLALELWRNLPFFFF